MCLLGLFFFFFGCSVLFWFHNSLFVLPVNSRYSRYSIPNPRYSFFYCQSLEIKLSPHFLKWKQRDVFLWWRSCNSSPLQLRLSTLTAQPRVLLYWSIVKTMGSLSEGLYFSRKATTNLLDRTKFQYLVFSVWWGLKRTGKDSKHQSTEGKWQLHVISLPLISPNFLALIFAIP